MYCPLCGAPWSPSHLSCLLEGAPPPVSAEMFESAPTSQIGAVLGGRYRIRGFIGSGAMSRVFIAEDVQTSEPFAIKLFVNATGQEPEARARFMREAETAMSIRHPNVVKILEHGENAEGAPYLVMEPLLGESLQDYLNREGAMPTDLALTMLRQAAAGLCAAHRVGVFHRDVKPENLFLIGPRGEPYGLKILDFGLAKIGWKPPSRPDLAIGTFQYMAPEQIVGEFADARTDVYGLGVVMFRVLTNHLPFDVRLDSELLAHQLVSPAPPPSWLVEDIPPDVEAILLTAMRKRPENRYPTMADLLADLDRVVGLRSGSRTGLKMRREPDQFEPATPFGRMIANLLYQRLGAEPPFSAKPPSSAR